MIQISRILKSTIWFLIILIIAIALIVSYQTYINLSLESASKSADALLAEQHQKLIHDILVGDGGVTEVFATDGFWYSIKNEDGTESVGYFDPLAVATSGRFSEGEIRTLATSLKGAHMVSKNNMKVVSEKQLPSWAQFHNAIYEFQKPGMYKNTKDILTERVKSKSVTVDDAWRLGYVYELEGDYAKRDALRAKACAIDPKYCSAANTVIIQGRVLDMSGDPVAGATVQVLGSEVRATTDATGTYSLSVAVNPPQKVRVSGTKRNFSDGVSSVLVANKSLKKMTAPTIELTSALRVVTIDTKSKTIISKSGGSLQDNAYEIVGENSTYHIPLDAIVDTTGHAYKGLVDVYVYEFTRGSIPRSLANVDTFDQVSGYAGNLMKSFGMPYIQFFTQDGKELQVFKSNPMVLTYKIANMNDLRTNAAHIYEPLTEADMVDLRSASVRETPYPIDRQYLIDHNILRFPAFWVFDRKKGVWENIGVRVLNVDGTIESLFYTINNDK